MKPSRRIKPKKKIARRIVTGILIASLAAGGGKLTHHLIKKHSANVKQKKELRQELINHNPLALQKKFPKFPAKDLLFYDSLAVKTKLPIYKVMRTLYLNIKFNAEGQVIHESIRSAFYTWENQAKNHANPAESARAKRVLSILNAFMESPNAGKWSMLKWLKEKQQLKIRKELERIDETEK